VSEQPNFVLGALFAAAALVAALVLAGLILLGGEGAAEVGATVIGAFSACIVFLLGLEHVPFSSIVIVLFSTASAAGFIRTLRAYRRERRLLAALPLEPVDDGPLAEAARAAGVRLLLLPASRPSAFCLGLLRPRVVISTGLLERLDADEHEAVVWHEAVHARGREPLKCLLAWLCTGTFFWLPALRQLLDRYLLVKEIAADQAYRQGPRTTPVRVHYSLRRVPESSYRARAADERIGYFTVVARDYAKAPDAKSVFSRLVTRWHLEKADATLELSPPVQTIVW
jgi:hypothetical protein